MQSSISIERTEIPPFSLAEKSFPKIDYGDAYHCEFLSVRELKVEDVVMAFFTSAPKIVSSLFWLRNKLVKPFGLKISESSDRKSDLKNFKVEKGNALGIFCVMDKSTNEVLIGEDDKHLNFRISFLLKRMDASAAYTFILSTTVMMKNSFGKFYFIPVKPFHKLIVRGMIKSIVNQLATN